MSHRETRGFSLIEVMVVVAIVALLAAVALPSYAAYIKRSRILDAVARLSDARARMEQFFLDQRTYVDDTGQCGVTPPGTGTADAFSVQCEATTTSFTYKATGLRSSGMDAFVYSIDQSGTKATLSVPGDWQRTADCWTIRQDGLCV